MLISCSNGNCEMKVSRKDFEDHATKKCQWRTVHCDHCCELYPDCQMEVNNHILQSLQQTPPPAPLKVPSHLHRL